MSGISLQLYIVDAFTDEPFKGNSCSVCLLPNDHVLSDDLLLQVANEMNKTEVAFLKCLSQSDNFLDGHVFSLRWFTPQCEIKMCGNGTLSSAAVLFNKIGNKQDRVVFKTLSGDLIVRREGEFLHMDFPVGQPKEQRRGDHEQLIKGLGDIPGVTDIVYCNFLNYLLIKLRDDWSMKEFEAWTPDINAIRSSIEKKTRVVIVTTRGSRKHGYINRNGDQYDFVSRCFTPWTNVMEHSATGSTKTVLAHFWSQKLGQDEFFVKQCSQRSGEFSLKLRGNRVDILAKAVIVMEGVFTL